MFNHGRFGDGHIATFDRNTVLKLGPITQLSLQAFDTVWYADAGYRNIQWLERLASRATSRATARSRSACAASSARRPRSGTSRVRRRAVPCRRRRASTRRTNVSVAYAYHRKRDELYLVYGDASAAVTKPALIMKYVFYLGGEKGT